VLRGREGRSCTCGRRYSAPAGKARVSAAYQVFRRDRYSHIRCDVARRKAPRAQMSGDSI
jgi:hypothetical protein